MTTTQTRTTIVRRFTRRAITATALALFAAAAVTTLSRPSQASAAGGSAAVALAAAPDRAPVPAKAAKPAKKTEDDDRPAKKGKRPPKAKAVTGVVNINTATEAELQMLPGVGPAKAERVIAFRTERGKFRRVQDLRRVKGFGYKTLKKLEPHLAITGPTTIKVADAEE